jgi:glycosyltransferase involved in cell wall biosynthesis
VVGGLFRCAEEKRPLLWLKAAGQLLRRRPNAHFILFGQGFDTSPGEAGAMERLFSGYRLVLGLDDAARQQALALRVQDFVRDHGLGGRVHCPGQVRDAASAMAAMDAMLLTSTMEGTPNAVLEAQLQGIPVVVGAGGGAAEACLPGVTGFALSCPTSRRLAEALDRALAPDFKTRAAAEGPGFVARRYGLGRMAAETLALYG